MKLLRTVILVFTFLYSSFVYGDPSNDSNNLPNTLLNATSYKTTRELCYAFTYNNGRPPMRGVLEAYHPFIKDKKYKNGVIQWLSLESHSFRNTFLSFGQNSDELFPLNTDYVQFLVETEGFREGIEDCAMANNLEFAPLHDKMRGAILGIDRNRSLDGYIMEGVIGGALFRAFKTGLSFTKVFLRNRKVYRWLANTKVVKALRERITFLQRLRWRLAGTGASAAGIVFQRGDSPYYQIHSQSAIAGDQYVKNTQNLANHISSEDRLWIRRYQVYDMMIEKLQIETVGIRYNIPINLYTEKLWQCDPAIRIMKPFCKLLNVYVVDYWRVKRRLDELGSDIYEDRNAMLLNEVEGMFMVRKELLKKEVESGDRRKEITLRILNISENDPNFTCNFNEPALTEPLCRLHFLYVVNSFKDLSPAQSEELRRLEAALL